LTDFPSIQQQDGFLPIQDYGLIGDGSGAALVGRDGSIGWLCVPRFDSPPLICRILDRTKGGRLSVTMEGVRESRQFYRSGAPVLVTELRSDHALLRITDVMTVQRGAVLHDMLSVARSELVRLVEAVEGEIHARFSLAPRGGARTERRGGGIRIVCEKHDLPELHLASSVPITGLDFRFHLSAGQQARFTLKWGPRAHLREGSDGGDSIESTETAWLRWLESFEYRGPRPDLVKRSAVTLKLLDYFENGAIVAAPTSSLPEAIGGLRNWDYRYSWIRDAAFSVYALRRIGFRQVAWHFLSWVLDVAERGGRPRVLYDLDGNQPPAEWRDGELEGYRCSQPVRWGNAAADQRQHDVFGEILDCAFQWVSGGQTIDADLWHKLSVLAEAAAREWKEPDQGIWEIRSTGKPFTYSAALCQVALDRAARLSRQLGLPGEVEAWERHARQIRDAILADAWNPEVGAICGSLFGHELDASVLALPLRRVVEATHPRMVATTEAIRARLNAGSDLLFRYNPELFEDGLAGKEGAFLLCSFWLADNLTDQGRLDEASRLFESLCSRVNHLGLLPEQIDPVSGDFLGNFPQAFSHVGLISSGVRLGRRGVK